MSLRLSSSHENGPLRGSLPSLGFFRGLCAIKPFNPAVTENTEGFGRDPSVFVAARNLRQPR